MLQEGYELSEEEKLILQKVLDGNIAFRKIEEFTYPISGKTSEACDTGVYKTRIEHIQNFSLDVEAATTKKY